MMDRTNLDLSPLSEQQGIEYRMSDNVSYDSSLNGLTDIRQEINRDQSATPGYFDQTMSNYSILASKTEDSYTGIWPGGVKTYPLDENTTTSFSERSHISSWSLELAALICSLGTTIAMIIILQSQNGRPIEDWKFPTSLNTVVSALGTISKACLAFAISACIGQQRWNWLHTRRDHLLAFSKFDEASRGPLGSVKLLFWVKLKHWAALGALVTVLALAYDPFLQAVISYVGRLQPGSSVGEFLPTIPRADKINWTLLVSSSNVIIETSSGYDLGPSSYSRPDFGFLSALYNGFYNSSRATQAVQYNCLTGNCTWPVFTSFAVCSSCNDISNHITTSRISASETRYELPYVQITNTNEFYWPFKTEGTNVTVVDNLMTANRTMFAGLTTSFWYSKTLISAFAIMRANDDYLTGAKPWNESVPIATECALYLCTNAYRTEAVNGNLNETIIGSWSEKEPRSWEPIDPISWDWDDYLPSRESLFGEPAYGYYDIVDRTDLQLVIPTDYLADLPANVTRRFNTTQDTISSIVEFLWDWDRPEVSEEQGLLVYFDYAEELHVTPPIMEALWKSTNLTTTFENAAHSLTNYIRETASIYEIGTTTQWTIYFKVDWSFLALPIIVFVGGCLYVLLTIFETSRLALPAWKEDTLVTLAYGFDEETQRRLRTADSNGRLTSVARQTMVKFENDGYGLRLPGTSSKHTAGS